MRKYLTGGLLAAAMLAASAPSAQAAPVCREARVLGIYVVTACAEPTYSTGQSGTTVAPSVRVTCMVDTLYASDPCLTVNPGAGVARTGFVPSASPPPVILDPATASVGIGDGTVGTLWVRGVPYTVNIGATCVGDPSVC